MKLIDTFRALLGSSHPHPTQASRGPAVQLNGERFTVRRAQRMRDGYVSWPARPALLPRFCKITDVSFNGAAIEIDGDPPDAELWTSKALLYIASDDREVQCELIWQRGRRFGLHFAGKPQPPSRAYT